MTSFEHVHSHNAACCFCTGGAHSEMLAKAAETDGLVCVPLASDERATGTLSRRRFLAAAGATTGAFAASAWLSPSWFLSAASAEPVAKPNVLVHIFLRGGADGLSLVAPVTDGLYHSLRDGIDVKESAALGLDKVFGLHPAAVNLKRLFDQGCVAVVPAAGMAMKNRSHFDAQSFMESGTVAKRLPTGWLGRYLSGSATGSTQALRAIAGGAGTPASLRGFPAVSVPSVGSLLMPSAANRWAGQSSQFAASLKSLYANTTDPLLGAEAAVAFAASAAISPIAASANPPSTWPNGWATSLWPIAKLITSGIPVEVATADFGSWDTHYSMGSPTDKSARMASLVTNLDNALGAFFSYLGAEASRVTVVVMSEFGRRIAVNSSGGTDHGKGGVMFVVGAGVSSGVKGAWPGLANSDDGDVRVVNDYRLVVAEVLQRRMGLVDTNAVFPDFDASRSRWLGVTTPSNPEQASLKKTA